ncbi:hypothetical protein L0Y69_01405 [bacterium]|nr:hypothetical protein [bacterium]
MSGVRILERAQNIRVGFFLLSENRREDEDENHRGDGSIGHRAGFIFKKENIAPENCADGIRKLGESGNKKIVFERIAKEPVCIADFGRKNQARKKCDRECEVRGYPFSPRFVFLAGHESRDNFFAAVISDCIRDDSADNPAGEKQEKRVPISEHCNAERNEKQTA